MRYERFPPRPEIADYVEHFWLVEAHIGDQWHDEILVPNGRPTLLISLGETGRRRDIETLEDTPNTSGLSGIGTRPVVIGQKGRVLLLAAQLSPFGPAALASAAHVDKHISLADLSGTDTARSLQSTLERHGVGRPGIEALEDWMVQRLQPLPDVTIAALNRTYAQLDGEVPDDVEAWARLSGLSYGQLYRLFRSHVGITPKTALMIARYQAMVGELLAGQRGDGLAQVALLQGYYDQAHGNRDFRRFTGISPKAFIRTLNGIARMMHRQA